MHRSKSNVRLTLAALLAGTAMSPAPAQDDPAARVPPPRAYTTSRGGVDLQTGTYLYSNQDLSIGGAHMAGGISLVRDYSTAQLNTTAEVYKAFGDFDHNLDVRLWITLVPVEGATNPGQWDRRATVQIGTQSKAFIRDSDPTDPFKLEGGNADSKLEWSTGQPHVYTDREGTRYTFRGTSPNSLGDNCSNFSCGFVANIVKLDGERLDFNYVSSRLRSVISNRGYAIIFEENPTTQRVTKACAINLATQYYNGTDTCPTGARSVTYTYGAITGYSGSTFGYTDPAGKTYAYSSTKFWKPGNSTAEVALTLAGRCCVPEGMAPVEVTRQDFADGDWITYSYAPFPEHPTFNTTRKTATVTDSSGTITATYKERNYQRDRQWYYFVSDGPISVVDQLGRTTLQDYPVSICSFDICGVDEVKSVTAPEGNSENYLYFRPGAVSERRLKAKSGTGLADIVETMTYPPNTEPNWALRYKPSTHTDANGKTTTYTYDPTTALLTRVTMPAVQVNATGTAIAPVKRFTYAQRYAWIRNSSSGYSQMANPIWLLTEERTCKTTATVSNACAGGSADEVVTTYDYGPNSGPNNLLLRGQVVTAGGVSLRTCYGYDAYGNRISETKPNANLGSCA